MCRETPWCPGGGEVPDGLLVPQFLLLLLFKFCAQCPYECSTGLEDALGLVPYFFSPSSLMEMPVFPALMRNLEQTMDSECDADFDLQQNHSCPNPTCRFGEISSACLLSHPLFLPDTTTQERKKEDIWDRAGLQWAPSVLCVCRSVPTRL